LNPKLHQKARVELLRFIFNQIFLGSL